MNLNEKPDSKLDFPADKSLKMSAGTTRKQRIVVVGAGPVGTLAALYAAGRGDQVEIYEYREGKSASNLYRMLASP